MATDSELANAIAKMLTRGNAFRLYVQGKGWLDCTDLSDAIKEVIAATKGTHATD